MELRLLQMRREMDSLHSHIMSQKYGGEDAPMKVRWAGRKYLHGDVSIGILSLARSMASWPFVGLTWGTQHGSMVRAVRC